MRRSIRCILEDDSRALEKLLDALSSGGEFRKSLLDLVGLRVAFLPCVLIFCLVVLGITVGQALKSPAVTVELLLLPFCVCVIYFHGLLLGAYVFAVYLICLLY